MWYFRQFIDGDVGIWKIRGAGVPKEGQPRSFLQTIEGHRIAKEGDPQHVGIDFDKFGKPVRYYISTRAEATSKNAAKADSKKNRSKRARASDFIFYANFPGERAERERGVSRFLQSLAAFGDIEQIMDAMLQKVKNEAFMGIKFRMEPAADGTLFPGMEEAKKQADGNTRKQIALVPGLNLNLLEGEDADIFEGKSPGADWIPFIRFMFRYIGTAIGLPLEMMLMDFADTNYSGGRALLELAKHRFRIDQYNLSIPSSNAFEFWLAREIKYGDMEPPEALLENKTAWAHRWITPGWPYIDPQKEIQAHALALSLGLTTRQQLLDEINDGTDFADLIVQLAKEMDMARVAGVPLVIGQPGQSMLNGPATNKDETNEETTDED